MMDEMLCSYTGKGSFDSKILPPNHKTSPESIKFIKDLLKQPKNMSLLFRASEHHFQASDFHQHCDNIDHTLVLVKTEFGKILGGYTPLRWNAVKGKFAVDLSRSSFLFSVDLKEKYPIVREKESIWCNPRCGPVFGGGSGHDLGLPDAADKESFFCFPNAYDGMGKYSRNKAGFEAYSGSSTSQCGVEEYEVFRV